MLKAIAAAFATFIIATPAVALDRDDLIGAWVTEWSNAADEAPSGGGLMRLSADTSRDGLDGVTPAPGWDGVMTGRVEAAENGALVWVGQWASIWPEGATMGTFRLVFSDADTFTGTWSSNDGEVQNGVWLGRRAP